MTGFGVLFVCTGNLYRSPIAERLLTARLGLHASGFGIGSAGTQAIPETPMSPRTAAVIGELGGEAEGFASRRLTAELVASADLVLGLAREHREAAVRLHPTALRRCFTLGEFGRLTERQDTGSGLPGVVARAAASRASTRPAQLEDEDIEDPDGRPMEDLRSCAARIDEALRRVAGVLTAGHEALLNT